MPAVTAKRSHPPSRAQRLPKKRRRRQGEYHSESESETDGADSAGQDFSAVNLPDSGSDSDDIQNVVADEGVSDGSRSGHFSSSGGEELARQKPSLKSRWGDKSTQKKPPAVPDGPRNKDEQVDADEDWHDDDDDIEDEDEDDNGDDSDSEAQSDSDQSSAYGPTQQKKRTKSKRKDPSAFATSMSKILSTKLSTTRRPDPVLARNADAQVASRAVVESALEAKARRQLRDRKRAAQEKGRVKDVLLGRPSTGRLEDVTRPGELKDGVGVEQVDGLGGRGGRSVAEVQEEERRLRKVAQRGVVKLFNAVRAAQISAVEAEAGARRDGVLGAGKREGKVQELSRQRFLDLIASGGGGLKKGAALEEA